MYCSRLYLLLRHYPTPTMALSAFKHASVPTEHGTVRTYEVAYVSTLRVHDWLTSVNRVAPDGRHFLLRRCNIDMRSEKQLPKQ